MKEAKIEITVIQTDSGKIRIKFKDGSNYPVPDSMENIGILSALEVELKYALKRAEQEKVTDEDIEIYFPCEVGQLVMTEKDMSEDAVRLANYYRRQGARAMRDRKITHNK